MTPPLTNSLTLYHDDLLHLRRETSIVECVTVYHFEALCLDNPIMVSYRETFEKKSDALRVLIEMVKREEALENEEATQTAIEMLAHVDGQISGAAGAGGKN